MKTEHHQNEDSRIAGLYRQLGDAGLPAWLDAGTLVAYVAGELSPSLAQRVQNALDQSPELTALHASLVELAPHSEVLAQSLAGQIQHQGHRQIHHTGSRHAVRRSAHHRRARWMGTAAALLLAVAGVWGWQQLDSTQQTATASNPPAAIQQADTIFDSGMDQRLAVGADKVDSDKIFRTSFNHKSS